MCTAPGSLSAPCALAAQWRHCLCQLVTPLTVDKWKYKIHKGSSNTFAFFLFYINILISMLYISLI